MSEIVRLAREAIRIGMCKAYSLYAFAVFGKKVSAYGFFRVQMPENVRIGTGCCINADVLIVGRNKILIGDNVILSARVMLIDTGLEIGDAEIGNAEKEHIESYVCIENDVWVGAGAIILPGVTLGKGCVVGAGSVVTRSIPPYTVAVGNPARPIREISVLSAAGQT